MQKLINALTKVVDFIETEQEFTCSMLNENLEVTEIEQLTENVVTEALAVAPTEQDKDFINLNDHCVAVTANFITDLLEESYKAKYLDFYDKAQAKCERYHEEEMC